MVWTSPMTFTSNTVLAAADLNINLRDNLNEMSPAKATTPGSLIISDSPNSVQERTPTADYVSVTESTTSATFTDLNTVGPSVTVETGSTAYVTLYCNCYTTSIKAWMSYEIDGNNQIAAATSWAMGVASTGGQRQGLTIMHNGLIPGLNTFTAKYRLSGSGTATFSVRRLAVLPL